MRLQLGRGDWIQTYSGKAFFPLDPKPEDIDIEDIAHALSMSCRYSGHTKNFYSVAQHSVLVSNNLPDKLALWGLLHDASEAYLTDVPTPIKPMLSEYKTLEKSIMKVICQKFGLPEEEPSEVKRIDSAILADESWQLMSPPPQNWCLPEPALGIDIFPWSMLESKKLFLNRFYELKNGK